jgi:hypothetical protein
MLDNAESLDTILALIKQMEATLLGLKQLRGYIGTGAGQQMLEVLIEESEANLAEVKRRIIQWGRGWLTRLSHMRYSGGVASYLEVLTNETNYFSAELSLVQAQLNELLALVQLYKGLGGGWEQ